MKPAIYSPRGVIQFQDENSSVFESFSYKFFQPIPLDLNKLGTVYDPNSRLAGTITESGGILTIPISSGWSGTDPSSGFWWGFKIPELFGPTLNYGTGIGRRAIRMGFKVKLDEPLTTVDLAVIAGPVETVGSMAASNPQILQGIRSILRGISFNNSGGVWTSSVGTAFVQNRGAIANMLLLEDQLIGTRGGITIQEDNDLNVNGLADNSAGGDLQITFSPTGEAYAHLAVLVMTDPGAPASFNLQLAAWVQPALVYEYENT